MQVLLLTHYFEPEDGAPQRRWYALVERLVGAGHQVHVIAPEPHHPTGRPQPGHHPNVLAGASAVGPHGGVVHRVSFLPHNSNVVSRTIDHVWVAGSTVRTAASLARTNKIAPDAVVATAPALPTLVAGRLLARRFEVPFIAEMRDAWPDLVSHTPGLGSPRGLKARIKAAVFEAVTALQREASLVVTTTESFATVLRARGVPRVEVIRNGTSLARYAAIPPTVHDHDELRVLYMGTVGRSQGLEHVVRAVALARRRGVNIAARIIGYGADLARLRTLNSALGDPVEIVGRVDASEVFHHYVWADTTIVSLRAWEPFEWTVPSKLYELLATGKHVTAIVAGEAARIVEESAAGNVIAPGDPEAVAALWASLATDRTRVSSRAGGRAWVAEHVDYDVIASRYRSVLEEAVRH